MNYELHHKDSNGNLRSSSGNIGLWAFAKHFAFAGFGIHRGLSPVFRFLGFLVEHPQYWEENPGRFSMPPVLRNDPSERAILSNRIGRAFGDFFAKKIYGARFTHCYEDAMVQFGHPVSKSRPDFYCDTLSQQFAVECKGLKVPSVSEKAMEGHKKQADNGPLSVDFHVASVAYNLYDSPKIRFYDPKNEGAEYAQIQNEHLRTQYYRQILKMFKPSSSERFRANFPDYLVLCSPSDPSSKLQVVVHRGIIESRGEEFEFLTDVEAQSGENYYIDFDGVGLIRS